MVRIRYADLPAGLHVSAQAEGRRTIIYLLPGLTPEQRKAALIRVRSGARMGYEPKLTPAGMAVAVAADRFRVTIKNGALAMRAHPLLLIPPLIVFVSAALVFVLLASVSITFRPSGPPYATGRHGEHFRQAGGQGGGNHRSAAGGQLTPGSSGSPDPSSSTGRSHEPGQSSSPSPSPTSSTSGSSSPSPQPSSPTPSQSSSPAPSPSPSSSGVCVRVGPLGVCLPL